MTQVEFQNAIEYIEGQLENGYLDLGIHDYDEIEIVKAAIEEYRRNHYEHELP